MYDDYGNPFSAHLSAHSTDGNWYSMSYMLENPSYDGAIFVLDATSQFVRTVPLHLGRKLMIHDAVATNMWSS